MQTFKPGWKDIFRMNQKELESEIRKVSRDEALDPRRKAYLIQNLMTRLQSQKIMNISLFLIMTIVFLTILIAVAGLLLSKNFRKK